MRGGSFKLGRAFGIDVKVHWTFLLLLLFFAGYGYAQSGNLFGALLATGLVVVLFFFVVLHEYGHSLVAQRLGIEVHGMLTRREILAAAHSPGRFYYVRDLMKTKFPTLSPGADLFEEGYRFLQQSGLRALPVVEGGKLVGMLTIEDIGHASLLRDQPTTRR